jgi:purine-binding chemotaxis protein CheW
VVDLVKIRKKAKEKLTADQLTADSAQLTGEAAAPSAPAPTPVSGQLSAASSNPAASSDPAVTPDPAPATPQPPPTTHPDKLTRFKETAGRLRDDAAAETAAQEQTASATDQLELLTFVIANENYAVDIERIVEIVRPRPITRVPNADPSILGISSLRGTIVTLVDVRARLRHAQVDETPDTRVIVLDHHSETLGFEVDRVLRVVKVAPGAVEPHPVVHSSEADESIRGVFRHAGALTILLDFDKLLGPGH